MLIPVLAGAYPIHQKHQIVRHVVRGQRFLPKPVNRPCVSGDSDLKHAKHPLTQLHTSLTKRHHGFALITLTGQGLALSRILDSFYETDRNVCFANTESPPLAYL